MGAPLQHTPALSETPPPPLTHRLLEALVAPRAAAKGDPAAQAAAVANGDVLVRSGGVQLMAALVAGEGDEAGRCLVFYGQAASVTAGQALAAWRCEYSPALPSPFGRVQCLVLLLVRRGTRGFGAPCAGAAVQPACRLQPG